MSTQSTEAPASITEGRLHPLSWLFDLSTHAKGFLLPVVALLVTARWTNIDALFFPAIVVVIVHALVRQLSLRYVLSDTELVVRRNFLVHRSERHIPFARIHNLKTSASPIHRWLGVVEVAVETASGPEPEATLRVLSRDAFTEIHGRVARYAPPLAASASPGADGRPSRMTANPVLFDMSLGDVVLCGLLYSRGLVIAVAMAGLAWEITASLQGGQPWDPRSWTTPWPIVRARGRELLLAASMVSPLAVAAVLVAVFALLKLFSVIWALASLHGFRVERSATGITVEHGVFPRTATAIPFSRIQRVVVRERPLQRLMGYVEVQLDTVGGGQEGNKAPVWLAPLVTRSAMPELLSAVDATTGPEAGSWQPLDPRAGARMRTRMLIVLTIAALLASPTAGWRLALAGLAMAAPLGLVLATRQARVFRYMLTPAHVLMRHGWLWRSLQITWVDRIQVVTLGASPFDRRHGMASVLVDTAAGGTLDTRMHIPFLARDTAGRLARRLATAAAATRFEWQSGRVNVESRCTDTSTKEPA